MGQPPAPPWRTVWVGAPVACSSGVPREAPGASVSPALTQLQAGSPVSGCLAQAGWGLQRPPWASRVLSPAPSGLPARRVCDAACSATQPTSVFPSFIIF